MRRSRGQLKEFNQYRETEIEHITAVREEKINQEPEQNGNITFRGDGGRIQGRWGVLIRSLLITARNIISGSGGLRGNSHLAGILPVSLNVSPSLLIPLNHLVHRQRLHKKTT